MPSSWGASVVNAAGGTLITQGLADDGGFARVSDEYIITQDPDVIVVVPHGNSKDIPSISDFYRNNPAWSTLKAVKNGNVHVVVDDALLQPDTDVGNTIKRVRTQFLKNWN
jgi:ABC-type Fe3+-hydroxamate transport system substrate-binding protein